MLEGEEPGEPVRVPLMLDLEPIQLEAELNAAERLSVTMGQIQSTAERLWGRRLVDERERRLGSDRLVGSPIPPARRGHVTRVLLRELEQAL